MHSRSPHLRFAQLADWVEGRLSPDEQTAARAHLDHCPRCATKAAELERLVILMQTDESVEVAPEVLASVIHLFNSRAAASPPLATLRRVIAALRFDSLQQTPAFGLRSGLTAERQYLFSTPENDVQIQVEPSGELWAISGQVLGICAGGDAELRGDQVSAVCALSEGCEFALPSVPSGTYTLLLRLRDIELEIPDLTLGD